MINESIYGSWNNMNNRRQNGWDRMDMIDRIDDVEWNIIYLWIRKAQIWKQHRMHGVGTSSPSGATCPKNLLLSPNALSNNFPKIEKTNFSIEISSKMFAIFKDFPPSRALPDHLGGWHPKVSPEPKSCMCHWEWTHKFVWFRRCSFPGIICRLLVSIWSRVLQIGGPGGQSGK